MDNKEKNQKKRIFITVESTTAVVAEIDALVKKLNSEGHLYNRSDIVRLCIAQYLKKK